MNADPIFYTQVDDSVINVLNKRLQYYATENRESGAHEWLFKKMAWAVASAKNGEREAMIEISNKGGIGKAGVYTQQPSNDGSSKYYPKPQIESVNVSAEGDFGSIIKIELKFQVHTLADLNAMQAFFDIGGDLSVSWGWNYAGGAGGRDGNFNGKIYNFSYSVNSAGGFECATYAMMPGITIIGGNVDAPKKTAGEKLEDALGNVLSPNSIINKYKYEERRLASNSPISTDAKDNDGYLLIRYAQDWAEAKDPAGQPEQTEEEKQQNRANLDGKQLTKQTVQDSDPLIVFDSNFAKFIAYIDTLETVYEIQDENGKLYKVIAKKDGTYVFYADQTLYQNYNDAVSAASIKLQEDAAKKASEERIGGGVAALAAGALGAPIIGIGIAADAEARAREIENSVKATGDYHLYISLEKLVKDINEMARENSQWFSYNNVRIVCDGNVTKGLFPTDTTKLVSANPTELLIPGYATYGPKHTFTFGQTYEDATRLQGDLSKCMISFKWLQDIFTKVGMDKTKNSKSADSSVAGMLQKVFDLIYKHTGERFKLTMVTNPKGPGTEILIVDMNFIDTTDVYLYPITAVTQGSIARSISLSSKVPNEFQTAAFVSANNAFSGPNINMGNVVGNVANTPPPNSPISQTELAQSDPQALTDAKASMDAAGVTPNNVKSLQASMKRERISVPESFAVGKEVIPFPLDFSVTLDGIEGFIFGNAITCNYLPAVYKQESTKMAFTVTKVNHTISNNDWTTTLNTVCRIVSSGTETFTTA